MLDFALPSNTEIRPLHQHKDVRGELYEFHRASWTDKGAFPQWNILRSKANVLRGVHVHMIRWDYMQLVEGEMLLGLHDLRPENPADRISIVTRVSADEPVAIVVPPGVCHGFWFTRPSSLIIGLSDEWDTGDELGCRYDDPGLGLDWPAGEPILLPRDAAPARDYGTLRADWFASAELSEA